MADPNNKITLPTFEGFRTIDLLGAGSFGQVFKVERLDNNFQCCIKVINLHTVKVFDFRCFYLFIY